MKSKNKILKLAFMFSLVFTVMLSFSSIDTFTSNMLGKSVYEASYTVRADVGNHNSYKSTPKSSSSSKSYRSSGSSTSTSSHGSGSIGIGTIIIIIIIVVIVLAMSKGKGGNNMGGANTYESNNYQAPRPVISDRTGEISQAIMQTDKLFSASKFLGWSQEVFMSLQEAWTTRDWAVIRPFEKEELFKIHEKQLEEYKRLNRINILERICINQAYLYRYSKDAEYEYLTVYVNSAMNDYIIDAETKQVLEGDPHERYNRQYLMTFMRKIGVLTNPSTSNMSTKSCPNCGAPLNITSAGKCEYCDFIVTTGDHDWVLSDYDSVDEDTEIQQGGVFL